MARNRILTGKTITSLAASAVFLVLIIFTTGCASLFKPKLPEPQALKIPEPIHGNSGKYMCPFTSDGTVTEWVGKAKNAKVFQDIFTAGLAYAGTMALKQVPFVGGLLGYYLGKKVGREIAIEVAGGRDFIKSKSDLSFDQVEDLAVYLYAKHSTHEDYPKVFKVASSIYPELQNKYVKAIKKAQIK